MNQNINWHPVTSSQVKRIVHKVEEEKAIIEFKGGGVYEYEAFPQEKFERMKESASVGKFIGAEVKGKHKYRKITDAEELNAIGAAPVAK